MERILIIILIMNIVSWNVNGIRSRIFNAKSSSEIGKVKDIYPEENSPIFHLLQDLPDIICFQETRCDEKQGKRFKIPGYNSYFNCSKLDGARGPNRYSGTCVFVKDVISVKSVEFQIPNFDDQEGRIIILKIEEITLVTVYAPNSGSNYEKKINFIEAMVNFLDNLEGSVVFCGDLNIAIDTHFDKSKVKPGPGIYKHELEFYDRLININYNDTISKDDKIVYTWWDPRVVKVNGISKVRVENKGWRLDYFLVRDYNHVSHKVYKNIGESNPLASDHAPIILNQV